MALASVLYLLVVSGFFKVPPGKHRMLMGGAALFLAGVAVYAYWLMFNAPGKPLNVRINMNAEARACLNIYFPGILFFSIGANILMGIRQER